VVGVLAALLEASKVGKGQVVDAAMCDGAASLMSMFFDMAAAGRWTEQRESNFLDGGAHFYGVYELRMRPVHFDRLDRTAILRVAAPARRPFRRRLRSRRWIAKAWPALKQKLVDVSRPRPRDEWCTIMEGTDVLLRADPDHGRGPRSSA